MPIYEYRCPKGHHFERFQSMTAPAPESCDTCGAVPVEQVLYPIAIHYKGSGFYTTDYRSSAYQEKKKGETASKSGGDAASSTAPAKPATPSPEKPKSDRPKSDQIGRAHV